MQTHSKFQPILTDGLPDWNTDDSRWEDWYTEQKFYIQNGYQVGSEKITGRYYFHLNFATIEGIDERGYPTEAKPYHVDVMKELFDLVDYSMGRNENVFVWKARDKAYSYNMSSIAVKEMMFEKNNTVACLFPKGEQVMYKENFRAKFDATFNALPQCMKQYADLINTKDLLKYGWREKDEETNQETEKGSKNMIAFMKATNKDVLKSFRTKFIIIDEAGEIDCLKALTDTNTANMVRGGQKYGTQIIGGTSNAIHAGYKDVCFIWDNAATLGYNKFFIPRYKGLWGWVPKYKSGKIYKQDEQPIERRPAINHETGESLVEIAEEYFERELDRLKKMNDKDGELEFTQNYPKDENDAFLRTLSSPYPVIELEKHKRYIETNKAIREAITRGNIEIIYKDGNRTTQWTPNPNGRWQMYLPPNHNLLNADCIGVDTVVAEEVVDSPSKNAIIVYRPFQDMKTMGSLPVCIYHYRHANLSLFFQDLLATCIHYNAQCLIEYINQMPFDWMIENGGYQYLAQRPSILTELGSKAANRYGVKPASGGPVALSYAVEETKDNVDSHVFPELITELCKFGTVNTDLADAYKWAILLAKEHFKIKRIQSQARTEPVERKFERYCTKVNGKLIVVKSLKEAAQYKRR
jgi:hypothetical protein